MSSSNLDKEKKLVSLMQHMIKSQPKKKRSNKGSDLSAASKSNIVSGIKVTHDNFHTINKMIGNSMTAKNTRKSDRNSFLSSYSDTNPKKISLVNKQVPQHDASTEEKTKLRPSHSNMRLPTHEKSRQAFEYGVSSL